MKYIVRMTSVKPGVKIVSFIKLLAGTEMGLVRGKLAAEGLLDKRPIEIVLESPEAAQSLLQQLGQIGVCAEMTEMA